MPHIGPQARQAGLCNDSAQMVHRPVDRNVAYVVFGHKSADGICTNSLQTLHRLVTVHTLCPVTVTRLAHSKKSLGFIEDLN